MCQRRLTNIRERRAAGETDREIEVRDEVLEYLACADHSLIQLPNWRIVTGFSFEFSQKSS